MKCPVFKGAEKDFCLRDQCRFYNEAEGSCTYKIYKKLKVKDPASPPARGRGLKQYIYLGGCKPCLKNQSLRN